MQPAKNENRESFSIFLIKIVQSFRLPLDNGTIFVYNNMAKHKGSTMLPCKNKNGGIKNEKNISAQEAPENDGTRLQKKKEDS